MGTRRMIPRRSPGATLVSLLGITVATAPNRAAAQTLAIGKEHVCVITTTGRVKCWGGNGKGQLGYEDTETRGNYPESMGDALEYVDLGTGRTAVLITAGDQHTCAILDNATLKSLGFCLSHAVEKHRRLTTDLTLADPDGVNVKWSLDAPGGSFRGVLLYAFPHRARISMVLPQAHDENGIVGCVLHFKCWGNGSRGRLGQGNSTSYGSTKGTMGDALPAVNLGAGRTAVKVAGGEEFTCVLLDDLSVVCFGENGSGQLGVGHTDDVGKAAGDIGDALVDVDLGSDSDHAVADLTSGPCARFEDGKVKCWGYNLYGSTGVPGQVDVGIVAGDMGDSLPPIPLGSNLSATSIASGSHHNCAIVRDGNVKCWGKNTQGNVGLGNVFDLGDDDDELGDALPFVQLGLPAVALDGGDDHTCALLSDSSVKCWGHNFWGSLGIDDFRTRGDFPGEMGANLPRVNLGEGAKAVQISAGGASSCALLEGGSVKCWGRGEKGKLGQGHSKDLGDEAGEMSNLEAVDLGAGVLVASVVLPTPAPTTLAPTGAPVAPPTSVPTPASIPTGPVPSPSRVPSRAPTPAPVASTMPPPSRSPLAVPDGMGTVEPTSRRSPEPTAPPEAFPGDGTFEEEENDDDDQRETAGIDTDGSNDGGDRGGFSWAIITAAVAVPLMVTAIGLGLWSVHKVCRSPAPVTSLQVVPV